jgi:hypothetical protein
MHLRVQPVQRRYGLKYHTQSLVRHLSPEEQHHKGVLGKAQAATTCVWVPRRVVFQAQSDARSANSQRTKAEGQQALALAFRISDHMIAAP